MDPKLKSDLERTFTIIKTMRKYQERFFKGDKGSLKNAIYYENQADNMIARTIVDHGLTIVEPKGPPAQGSML